ncbi:hypothetical protein KC19_VG014100 [Ceratodon purpureus]|uniref:Uncharacterized protein n=1 Tax=Ceratodon purpureus TaxID=3225 RepID=A0A8T0HKZ0_CERPU|nr:hypothetical protein KC19_VG014100 [Ceratodon purpureus]
MENNLLQLPSYSKRRGAPLSSWCLQRGDANGVKPSISSLAMSKNSRRSWRWLLRRFWDQCQQPQVPRLEKMNPSRGREVLDDHLVPLKHYRVQNSRRSPLSQTSTHGVRLDVKKLRILSR